MDRNTQKIGMLNWVVLLVAALCSLLLGRYVDSSAGQVAGILMAFGTLASLVAYFQMRLEERERLESLEFDELNRAKSSASLFTADAENFPARHARQQFERFFVPGFTIIFILLLGGAIYWQWLALQKPAGLAADHSLVAMSLFGLFFLVLFLLGKYSTGLARLEGQRLLRPSGGYLMLGAYSSLAAAIGIAAVKADFPKVDVYVAWALVAVMAVVAIELILGLILEIYRPRIKGKPAQVLYDSRVVGLIGQPESLVATAAHALDYQFGFKISETWFYRFLQRALAWLILLQVAVLVLSTTVVFIEPGEQGLLERFGRPVAHRPVLEPGAHLKLPWPMDKVQRYRSSEVQTFNIGFEDPDRDKKEVVLWTVSHYKEELNMLVASRDELPSPDSAGAGAPPVNLLTVGIPVQYQIGDVRAWAYNHADSDQTLQRVATREVVRYLVSVDLHEIMSVGRGKAARELRARIQTRADELNLGVNILFVGLQDIHPPVSVAEAYQAVIGAQQDIEAKRFEAEGYRAERVPLAQAEAQRKVREAEIYRLNKLADAEARVAQFTNQRAAFDAAPRVYPQRLHLQSFATAIQGARKYVVATTNAHDVIQLNLEDKLRPDLLDITVPPPP